MEQEAWRAEVASLEQLDDRRDFIRVVACRL